ncbi:MAG: SpoIIE family protein phosphatase [Fimbriimonas sp.]|nr:SpoIIE family protein phosphatase [Fimbriimonas sp.]
MRILVADDDEVSAEILIQSLSSMNHDVVFASNGAEAWSLLQKEPFRVVILDWMMPEMDGMEVCRSIRAMQANSYTYIILLTGRTDRKDRLEALEGGADDFLTKPLDHGELVARLNVANRILESEEAVRRTNRELQQARQNEIELGATIQKRLLYRPPPRTTSAIETASLSIPSQQVDGDFCDFFTHGSNLVDVFVGDVMGKGVPAAMVGAGVKAGLQRCMISLLTQGGSPGLPSPERLIQSLDELICAELIDLGTFLTLCYARFDASTDTLTYVNCGHPKIVLWDALSGTCFLQDTTNVPLGFSGSESYQQHSARLQPGDLLLFYSDGVTDLKLPDGKRMGMSRFAAWVEDRGHLPLEEFLSEVRELRREGLEGLGVGDDFTCVAIRYRGLEQARAGSLRLWADSGSLRKVRNFVKGAASSARFGFTADEVSALLLGVQEAASNVVRHSRPGHKGIPIEVRLSASDGWFNVDMVYPGAHFDPITVPDPVLDGSKDGGFGISIIKKCVDEVAYRLEGHQNLLTLKKRANVFK